MHIFSVDSILSKPADPVFVGLCAETNARAGAKVVPKRDADEPVGVFGRRNGRVSVIEYSEMSRELSRAVNHDTGRLVFNAGNICNHYCTIDFIRDAAAWTRSEKRYVSTNKHTHTLSDITSSCFVCRQIPHCSKENSLLRSCY